MSHLLRWSTDALDEMELRASAVEAEADAPMAELACVVQVLPGAGGLHVAVLDRDARARREPADALDTPLAEAPLAFHVQPPKLVAPEVAARVPTSITYIISSLV